MQSELKQNPQGYVQEPNPTNNLENVDKKGNFQDIKNLGDKQLQSEDVLIGSLYRPGQEVGYPQEGLNAVSIGEKDLFVVTFHSAVASNVESNFFTCHYPCEILSASEVHENETTGACNLQIIKATSGTAVAAGTIVVPIINLKAAPLVPQITDVSGMNLRTRTMNRGDRLSTYVQSGSATGITKMTVTVYLQYRGRGDYHGTT